MALSLPQAREILGSDCITLEDAARGLGLAGSDMPADLTRKASEVPFSAPELDAARRDGQMLVFRLERDAEAPLTIQRFIERFPAVFEPKLLTKVGYSLRDEWGITLEPLAKTETCTAGWHLARKAPLAASFNLSYYEQEALLPPTSASAGRIRRRTAIEATYDVVLYHACRGQRLLTDAFDWTSSRTVDAGYLYVGGFAEQGMTLVGFSAAVRHATLGVCPTRGAA